MQVKRVPITNTIATLNWPESFSYCPQVEFSISHSDNVLHLHYKVREDVVRAECSHDGDHVWEDSCVEFFFAPADDGIYYNIECNPVGKLYFCYGQDRHGRQMISQESLASIRRSCSLGDEAFGVKEGPLDWEVSLDIPVSAFEKHNIKTLSGLSARGNFYKCGDKLPVRHYVSHFPIGTEKPDFHRPEFFGEISFE